MNRKPIIVIEKTGPNEFERECENLLNIGYKILSTNCSFVNSEAYDFCSSYQAILQIDPAKEGDSR